MASAQHLTPLVPGETSANATVRQLTGQIAQIERAIRNTTHYHIEEMRGQQRRLDTGRFVLGTILAGIDGMQDAAKLFTVDTTVIEAMVVPPRDDEAVHLIAAFSNGNPLEHQTWVLRCITRFGSIAASMEIPTEIEIVRAACFQWGMAVLDLFIAARHYTNPNKGTESGNIAFHNLRARAHAQTVAICIGELLRRQRVDPSAIVAGAREALSHWCLHPNATDYDKKMVTTEIGLIELNSKATLGNLPVVCIPSSDGNPAYDVNVALTIGVTMLAMGIRRGNPNHEAPLLMAVDGRGRDVSVSFRELGERIEGWLARHQGDHESLAANKITPAVAFVEYLQFHRGRNAITDLTA